LTTTAAAIGVGYAMGIDLDVIRMATTVATA
jgi:hypothetical protein